MVSSDFLVSSLCFRVKCNLHRYSAGTADPGILVRLPTATPTSDGRPRPRYREAGLDKL
jgi:hypothetical protein